MASVSFARALAHVLRREGGYVDHPQDPGGVTNHGITHATLAAWRGRPVGKEEVRALTREDAGAIYRSRYWDTIAGDALPAGLDLALFDFAVNSGPGRAVRTLQRLIGTPIDGRVGPQTLAAVAARPPAAMISALCRARLSFLERLITFSVFGRGWRRRVAATETAALALAAAVPSLPPAPKKEFDAMDLTKTMFQSRTVWANIIGLLALGASAFGLNVAGLDTGALTDAILQTIAGGSLVASTVFRIVATRRIS